jgi:hypothetical protein
MRGEREPAVGGRKRRFRADIERPGVRGEDAGGRAELAPDTPRELHHLAGEQADEGEQGQLGAALHQGEIRRDRERDSDAADQHDGQGSARKDARQRRGDAEHADEAAVAGKKRPEALGEIGPLDHVGDRHQAQKDAAGDREPQGDQLTRLLAVGRGDVAHVLAARWRRQRTCHGCTAETNSSAENVSCNVREA